MLQELYTQAKRKAAYIVMTLTLLTTACGAPIKNQNKQQPAQHVHRYCSAAVADINPVQLNQEQYRQYLDLTRECNTLAEQLETPDISYLERLAEKYSVEKRLKQLSNSHNTEMH